MRCSVLEAVKLDGGLFEEILIYAKADNIVEAQRVKEAERAAALESRRSHR